MLSELIGYADRFSVRPGEQIRFMVSTDHPTYEAAIVRLIHGDENPKGPGFKEQVIETAVNQTYSGRKQIIHSGSYVIIHDPAGLAATDSFTLQAWVMPTTPAMGHPQGLLTKWSAAESSGYGLVISDQGELGLWLGGEGVERFTSGSPMRPYEWYFVAATFDAATKTVRLYQLPRSDWPNDPSRAVIEGGSTLAPRRPNPAPLVMAASHVENAGTNRMAGHGLYNGKIDGPRLFGRALSAAEIEALRTGTTPEAVAGQTLIAAWDFAADIASAKVSDTSRNQLNGVVVNMPMRAVSGHNWTDSTTDFKQMPSEYNAIHFHEDDLEDARWESDFTFTVSDGLRSGAYAARLRSGDQEDHIPFFVCPARGTAGASTLVLFPTNTYLAYANFREVGIPGKNAPIDDYLAEHPEFSSSLYDRHSDRSGYCYSTRLRPIIPMRPKYRAKVTRAPRHFAADLYLIDWLEQKGFAYDVATDEDLHSEGLDLLSRYKVVITGSHPEYWTAPMMASLEQYRDSGGKIMYLGGNGFYWVTSIDPTRPHMIEVRRGIGGTRAWTSIPGEEYLSTTGEMGGLWRHRGKSPNTLVGIGFTAQGWADNTPGYTRQAGSFDPRMAAIFEGIGESEIIGNFGLVLGGAAGDELDRVEYKLGTPAHTIVLASSAGHDPSIMPVIEDFDQISADFITGVFPTVRADMVYLEASNGGAVFSTGAISWTGSLSHNNYDNSVSTVTENVLRLFLA